MAKPKRPMLRLLDLYCKQGGAGKGYRDAGFEVVGVDIEPQPRYPFEFVQADALEFVAGGLAGFDAVHASPPCQFTSKTQRIRGNDHANLIAATRELLAGVPYVIENVEDARAELVDPIMLCGTMFGKPYYRHRLFECSFPVTEPLHGEHHLPQTKMGRKPKPGEAMQAVGNFSGVQRARDEFEMPWASRDGLRECIPPVYAEHVGRALAAYLDPEGVHGPMPDAAAEPPDSDAGEHDPPGDSEILAVPEDFSE